MYAHAPLSILEAPDPRLKQKAAPVETIDNGLRGFTDAMLDAMYKAPGIGLAAPQVGVLERIVVADVSGEEDERRPMRLINPVILWRSAARSTVEEGCLSLPGQYAEVERAEAVRVRFLDERGETREIEADGLLARCLQHEIDHLDGVLFTDRISALKRSMILRKLAKARRGSTKRSA